MARDAARLEAARKRSIHEASVHGEAHDDVETAWDSVFEAQKSAAGPSEAEEARRRKLARKTEKRAEKRATENANAGSWSVYISGVPKEISYTAVHNLFSKVWVLHAAASSVRQHRPTFPKELRTRRPCSAALPRCARPIRAGRAA
jgi:hypothetical protein